MHGGGRRVCRLCVPVCARVLVGGSRGDGDPGLPGGWTPPLRRGRGLGPIGTIGSWGDFVHPLAGRLGFAPTLSPFLLGPAWIRRVCRKGGCSTCSWSSFIHLETKAAVPTIFSPFLPLRLHPYTALTYTHRCGLSPGSGTQGEGPASLACGGAP